MDWLFSIVIHNSAVAILLALLVWGLTRIWKNPPVAHLLWVLVLVKLVTPPTLNLDVSHWTPEPTSHDSQQTNVLPSAEPHPSLKNTARSSPASTRRPLAESELNPTADSNQRAVTVATPQRSASTPTPSTFSAAWNAIRPTLMQIWFAGAALVTLLAASRTIRFHRLLAGTLPAPRQLQATADDLSRRMGLRQSPAVRVVDGAIPPLVWCLGSRGTVVIPQWLLGAFHGDQVQMVLAHELAHLCRGDGWIRVIELVATSLYWWNPLFWIVRRQLHVAEEHCCDAWVTWVFPHQNHRYAESLFQAADLLPVSSPRLVLTSPFLSSKTLKQRIEMVLSNRAPRVPSPLAFLCLVLLAAVALPAGVQGQAANRPQNRTPRAAASGTNGPTQPPPTVSDKTTNQAAEPSRANAGANTQVTKRPLLSGSWKPQSLRSDRWKVASEEYQSWNWSFHDHEIQWTRPKQETIRLSFTVNPAASPPEIDLTFLNGSDQGQVCRGIYLASRHEIIICLEDPGANASRPQSFESGPASRKTLITLVPAEVLPIADEIEALQGTWKFDIYYSNWWPGRISNPPVGWANWTWSINDNEIHWTGMKGDDVSLTFTLDPSKSPREIDLTFVDGPHQGKKLRGIYKFSPGEGCWICFADPEGNVDRPTEVAYSGFGKHTMVSIQKTVDEKPDATTSTPADSAVDRSLEIDAAIAALRHRGAFVREFHPRNSPQYWVQIIAEELDDSDLEDVEIIGREVTLDLHLRKTAVTSGGLARLKTVGAIDTLELSGSAVDASLIAVLPSLPIRGTLELNSDLLTNPDLEPLAQCRQMSAVGLQGQQLSNDCLQYLLELPDLQRVSLGKNFTRAAFDVLARLERLTSLDVSSLTPQLSDLVKVPKLKTLSLSGKQLDDEAAQTIAETFQSLEEAYLRHTSITNAGVAHLSRMKTLKILTLDDSLIDDGVADSIRDMKQLQWFSAGNCLVGNDTLAAVCECPELWYLFLVGTQVTDEGIAPLTRVRKPLSLYLAHCRAVTDASITTLSQLTDSVGLNINLEGTGVTEDGIRELRKALPQAQIR